MQDMAQHADVTSAAALDRLLNALPARLQISGGRLFEADVQAMVEGRHMVARPRPPSPVRPEITGPLLEALVALRQHLSSPCFVCFTVLLALGQRRISRRF